jgi:hypothetical protein
MHSERKGDSDMGCNKCGQEIPEGGSFTHLGETLCEDCYITVRQNIVADDPIAVRAATKLREKMGMSGAEGLTDIQKAVYDFIEKAGPVTQEEIMEGLTLSWREMENHFAVLFHCELIKGFFDGEKYYITLFTDE